VSLPGLPAGAHAIELLPGARLWLLPQRAAFDPDLSLLLVADAHVGKAVSFRRLGVPVPGGTTAEALGRLDQAIASTSASHVVFLGDLLHSRRSLAPDTLASVRAWRERHAGLALSLVRGNHDAQAGDPPRELRVDCVDGPLRIGPWALLHEPQRVPGVFALAGHVHPGVVLGGRANDRLRLPCFRFDQGLGLLPAFGDFTGLHVSQRQPGERVLAIARDQVQPV
jgi:DNA ligase-associated metallophosphoesterase